MPTTRYVGTGAPGIYLEDLLGLTTGNKDIPDNLGFELKFYTKATNLITLFHKEPQPAGVVAYMVKRYGWKDAEGRLSFRHTIAGKSDRFDVTSDSNQIIIRRIGGNGIVPYWTHDDILSAAGAKLRRLLLVRGVRTGQSITYERVDLFENLELSYFIWEVSGGAVKIDFDAREMKPGSKGIRNHGTKFRVAPGDVCRLYSKKERIG
ncbi:MAG TPA: MvaI/BcnI family restriction endonuclease [Anaerolineales bacterium]|nr:MvaI/BcnI family restriction endonuclease [Anaerolineales bacterium]